METEYKLIETELHSNLINNPIQQKELRKAKIDWNSYAYPHSLINDVIIPHSEGKLENLREIPMIHGFKVYAYMNNWLSLSIANVNDTIAEEKQPGFT